MNESTVSSAFQRKFRETYPEAVLVKLADKSMIGLVDAFVSMNGNTLFMEYKIVTPLRDGSWDPEKIAAASPTQYAMAKRLATAAYCVYLFFVLDHEGLRKRIKYIKMWHPNTKAQCDYDSNIQVCNAINGQLDYLPNIS